MTTSHSPGPWYTSSKPHNAQGLIYAEDTGKNIAVSYDVRDAPLIAQAPAMYEVLDELTRHCMYMNNMQHAGQDLMPIDWSTLWDLQNRAQSIIVYLENPE